MKKFFLTVAGVFLIFVGIAGLILPIMPGWPFIFLGLSFIAPRLAERWKRRLWRRFSKKDIIYIEEWRRFGVHAGLTTKHFGLAFRKTDDLTDPANQERFRKALAESPVAKAHDIASQERFIFLNQVHGDRVAVLDDQALYQDPGFYRLPATDGVVTNQPGLSLLVFTADCLPIYFYAPRWVGLAHAGWRGTRMGIAAKTFKLIMQKSGCDPSQVHVVFGPAICRDHYEVGEEFREYFPTSAFHERVGATRRVARHDGRGSASPLHFDLVGENRRQLLEARMLEKNILDLHIDTFEESEDFYSHRRDGELAARMISFVYMVK